jgi:hypothetical protein
MIPSLKLTTTKANGVFLLKLSGYGNQLIRRNFKKPLTIHMILMDNYVSILDFIL